MVKNSFILWPFYLLHSPPTPISKLFKYFRSSFLSVQISEPYKAMLQTYHLTDFFMSSMFSLLVKSDIFLLNASLVMAILILISLVQSLVNRLPRCLKRSTSFSSLLFTLICNESLVVICQF